MAGIAKSTTTPDYKTTLYTMGLTKGLHSPHRKPHGAALAALLRIGTWRQSRRLGHCASGPTQQQTSHMSSATTHPTMPPSQMGQTRAIAGFQKNRSPELQCVRHLVESQSDPSSPQQPLQCSTQLQDKTGTARPPSAHDQSTDQAGTN